MSGAKYKILKMKSKLISLLLLFFSIYFFSQNVTKTYKNDIYTSYFSSDTKTPLIVEYTLYKGGGNCSRTDMRFTGDKSMATEKDYTHSGYDIGHMCNAEDFAFDCAKELKTFSFDNPLPQTARLNRGIWKEIETKIRKISQTDTVHIWCGGYNFTKKIGYGVGVPSYCFKIYKINRTGEIHYLIFPNDNSDSVKEISKIQFLQTIPKQYINYLK